MKKDIYDEQEPIKCISASDYLKRNTDSLRNAVENDLFSSAPNVEFVYEIAKSLSDELKGVISTYEEGTISLFC